MSITDPRFEVDLIRCSPPLGTALSHTLHPADEATSVTLLLSTTRAAGSVVCDSPFQSSRSLRAAGSPAASGLFDLGPLLIVLLIVVLEEGVLVIVLVGAAASRSRACGTGPDWFRGCHSGRRRPVDAPDLLRQTLLALQPTVLRHLRFILALTSLDGGAARRRALQERTGAETHTLRTMNGLNSRGWVKRHCIFLRPT